MPEVTVPTMKMPGRNHHSAPKFDGKPASLSPFLDEIEQLAEICGLTPKQQIEWTIRYSPSDERELWQMQESVGTEDWTKFKKELFELYPGSTGERKYAIANLQSVIEKQAKTKIGDAEEFGIYRRTFLTVATYLKNKSRLTDREISIYFLQGLQPSFRERVQSQLKAEDPKHHSDDPYTLAEISTAALFVLSCEHVEFDRMDAQLAPSPVKKETFDLSQGYESLNINAIVEEVAKRISSLEKQQNQGAPNLPKLRTNHCIFCSDPDHYLSSCPHVGEYIQKGLCQRNADGQIVLPNGSRISPREVPGRNLKERLDNWHKTNNTTPKVSTNFVGAAEFKKDYTGGQNMDELSKREQEELQVLENLVASTQKKIDCAKRKQAANKDKDGLLTRSRAQASQQENTPQAQTTDKATRPDPQYRYITPIEDPALIKKIAQQSLDTSITISTRELLSVAPDIRRHIKDQLITKRVATSAFLETIDDDEEPGVLVANVLATKAPAEKLIVAKHTEELRVIDVNIQGVKVIATIDDGSQIISIRANVWEKIGLPIRSDMIMVMESANKTKNETMGLLQDLKIVIGGNDFYLQVQVVQDAPYEMLLGRPFYTLTQASHKHFDNGDSRLTIFDPNTGDKITVPTRAKDSDHSRQGF